jgi:hypothetical protein
MLLFETEATIYGVTHGFKQTLPAVPRRLSPVAHSRLQQRARPVAPAVPPATTHARWRRQRHPPRRLRHRPPYPIRPMGESAWPAGRPARPCENPGPVPRWRPRCSGRSCSTIVDTRPRATLGGADIHRCNLDLVGDGVPMGRAGDPIVPRPGVGIGGAAEGARARNEAVRKKAANVPGMA